MDPAMDDRSLIRTIYFIAAFLLVSLIVGAVIVGNQVISLVVEQPRQALLVAMALVSYIGRSPVWWR